jgi:hypothetical protein
MPWQIALDGVEVSSDDFLIEDLEAAEKASGEPWAVQNPLRSVKVARAWLAIAMARSGSTDAEIAERLGVLTLKTIKNVFSLIPDEGEETDAAAPLAMVKPKPSTPASTTQESSPGAPGGSPGGRPKRAKRLSAASS